MLALLALARAAVARTVGRTALTRGLTGGGIAGGFTSILGGGGGDGDGPPRRRRRKRVLTSNDRADIAFITATLGAPAGKSFALIVAARA